ncbi:bifunctional non-homologous end joining protein LigD [Tumebacillus sp. BK434]|uniref:ATP-dependent DNA ligase n=1 Tax=Tumebacillus sp. BK434 TaxID=2512169 RepID=UPI00104D5752|nr:RNA ligase family protein [Tumebacillus sp. BK434]TCP59279.1 bifunctional non-homologous end joining protein LigD [Tumebacillus sp. BK434]
MITPKPLDPMALLMVDEPFDDPHHLAQIKWDGVRMLAYLDETGLSLFNRRQNERTDQYPELQELKTQVKARSLILDGEIVALGAGGKPSFSNILRRDLAKSSDKIRLISRELPIYFMVFDLLYLDGRWLVDEQLTTRQEWLTEVLQPSAQVQLVDSHATGVQLFRVMQEQGMEGIVIKEKAGRYHIGQRHPTWKKVKSFRKLNAVVGGATLRGGNVNSLLLGLYREGRLIYIGKAGSGLNNEGIAALTAFARGLSKQGHPFAVKPKLPASTAYDEVVYFPPQLVVEVQFMEWTSDMTLRAPTIQRFRELDPKECVL